MIQLFHKVCEGVVLMALISHFIEKTREGTYYTIPFTVPENVLKMTISYDYEHGATGALGDLHPTNTIDIGLCDENGMFLGWSGSAHKSIYISEHSATNGYLTKKINAGQWQILVGVYHIVDGGVTVNYTIDFEYPKEEVLFGDLHMHSTASDGAFDGYTLGKMALKKGLDFIGLANHNNYGENLHLPKLDNLTYIPAVEWTHYNGHMNFFGVLNPFENSFIANNENEMVKIIADAKKLGAVISVNHPKCRICPYLWQDDTSFDMMEIWNGPMRPSNIDAVNWWTELLKSGRKIAIVGGSDYHNKKGFARMGRPVTAVYTVGRGAEDILSNIKQGHSFVTSDINGPRLRLEYGNKIQGDTATFDKSIKLKIQASNLKGSTLKLVTDNGEKVLSKRCNEFNKEIPIDCTKFAYIIATKGHKSLYRIKAISNPIYFEEDKK